MLRTTRTFRRAATIVATTPLVAAGVLAFAPVGHMAGAVTQPTCPAGSDTPVDFDVLGEYTTTIATHEESATQTNICVRLANDVAFQIVVVRPDGTQPPKVTRDEDTGSCAQPVLNMSSPLPLTLSVGHDVANRVVCISLNGTRSIFRVSLGAVAGLPGIEVWTAGNTVLDQKVYCDESDYWTWYWCMQEPHRVV